jgi:hypothetical protein
MIVASRTGQRRPTAAAILAASHSHAQGAHAMTVFRGFAITILSGLAFGAGGGLVGYAIGRWLPDFYRTVLANRDGVDFDPAQVGLALGLTNGLVLGVGVGLVIVVAVTWYNARLPQRD